MSEAEKSRPKWYQTRVAIGAICTLVGIGIGASDTQPPEESEVYTSLTSKYDDLQDEMSSMQDAQKEASADLEARSEALDEREEKLGTQAKKLSALESELDDRASTVDAAEKAAEKQAESASAAAAEPVPFAGAASCTTTSSGTCIQGGQFCPKDKRGQKGTDANGRTYTCTGDGASTPHWR